MEMKIKEAVEITSTSTIHENHRHNKPWLTPFHLLYMVFGLCTISGIQSGAPSFEHNPHYFSIVLAVKSIPIGIPFEVGLPGFAMTTCTSMGVDAPRCSNHITRIITLWFRFLFFIPTVLELK
jgi:hypothetical protein